MDCLANKTLHDGEIDKSFALALTIQSSTSEVNLSKAGKSQKKIDNF